MRVLAIRGANLASLAGEFEVRLDADPLASAGLFAITGPTGAGKSTLLDALCVALYDKTPRLCARGGALIGHEGEPEEARISATDVRALLSRGAGAGYAEVDVIGKDGRALRARWDVRRARERATGRLQPQTMAIRDLATDKVEAGPKSEILATIESRVGLSFEQFRRSVLLPQGDFAAFLRA
ncbi:MAG TPA: AAA family ATPase, partial [Kofleriaceae bacterium]|nr:AAA family ATPase [Kofleriaceae bacterium]